MDKAYYDVIKSLYNIFKERFNFIRNNYFSIISTYLNKEKIDKKADEIMNKYFSYKESSALEKKYINNSFQKINKSISDAI